LDDRAVVPFRMRQARPGEVRSRGPSPDLMQDLRFVVAGLKGGDQDDRMPDLLRERGEPGGRVGFLDRDEAAMILAAHTQAAPPVADAAEHPPQRYHVRPREGRG